MYPVHLLRHAYTSALRPWSLWLAALQVAIALTILAMFDVYLPGDVAIAQAVQSAEVPGLEILSEFIYRIGLSPIFQIIALAAAVVMVLRNHRAMALFLLSTIVLRGSVVLLKELVQRPRPSPLLVDVSEQANGFSFPSSHVVGAVLLWGFFFFACDRLIENRRIRNWARWSSLAIIVLMGLQRVYAGAHWPTDVLAAYLWGGVILFLVVKAYAFYRPLPALHLDDQANCQYA